jgi:hypothetical protein
MAWLDLREFAGITMQKDSLHYQQFVETVSKGAKDIINITDRSPAWNSDWVSEDWFELTPPFVFENPTKSKMPKL